jgi:hypothetical protein
MSGLRGCKRPFGRARPEWVQSAEWRSLVFRGSSGCGGCHLTGASARAFRESRRQVRADNSNMDIFSGGIPVVDL